MAAGRPSASSGTPAGSMAAALERVPVRADTTCRQTLATNPHRRARHSSFAAFRCVTTYRPGSDIVKVHASAADRRMFEPPDERQFGELGPILVRLRRSDRRGA